ncbi:DNA-protecting protein DprA [Niveispirillum sp. SYP-B3756]|uniref:DNA-processing protein DprA n=1 Tax=Niveispirillum sp. SYP-B3756 TaxID=2662178 RepID=UPI0012928B78|nr:DNA-processing protein DprA [Niveispirillum sp. SYP-B3756]MQP64837.1 DNA-protecting protein DprA [Niveispirillum sp. SYP-B3756]
MHAPQSQFTRQDRMDWLRLIRTENVGPITFARLLERFGTAAAALAALPDLARKGGRQQPLRIPPKAEIERELAALEKRGARLICKGEAEYPRPLANVDDAPPVLTVLGFPALLARPCVGIVGARNASIVGRKMAEKLAHDLAEAGFTVVSGLARGIDTAAHEGSLAKGTAAVVAGGIDIIYPPENEALYRELAQRGAIIAESPLGTEPQARHFPRRNRLISGLSLGVVVVEAALKSGSLITARFAAEQGRDVFAVPGSPLDPRAQGCNRLIKEGAGLVETAEDVILALRNASLSPLSEPPGGLFRGGPGAAPDEKMVDKARAIVVESLSPTPVLIDELVRGCQLSAGVVLTILLELELAGRLQRHPGGRVSLI